VGQVTEDNIRLKTHTLNMWLLFTSMQQQWLCEYAWMLRFMDRASTVSGDGVFTERYELLCVKGRLLVHQTLNSAQNNLYTLIHRPINPLCITPTSPLRKVLSCYQPTLTRKTSGHSLENFIAANVLFHPIQGRHKRLNNQDRRKTVRNIDQTTEL
jgi:hypothetical protein